MLRNDPEIRHYIGAPTPQQNHCTFASNPRPGPLGDRRNRYAVTTVCLTMIPHAGETGLRTTLFTYNEPICVVPQRLILDDVLKTDQIRTRG